MTPETTTPPEKRLSTKLPKASAVDIQNRQNSVEQSRKLSKVNDILDSFDLPDTKEDELRSFLLWQKNKFLEEALGKPTSRRLQFLVQAQFDALKAKGLTNLLPDERRKFAELKQQLAGTENQKQEKQEETTVNEQTVMEETTQAIATEDTKQNKQEKVVATEKAKTEKNDKVIINEKSEITDISKTDQKILELRTAILENPAFSNSANIKAFTHLFAEIDTVDSHDESWKREILQRIINKLKSPWTLESIATDLGWTDSKEYREFKTQLLRIEPSLQASFESAEMNLAWSFAQIKLWTGTLEGVNLEDDTLTQTNWDIVIEAGKDTRNLSLVWSDYKLSSKLNPDYERQFHETSREVSDSLKPLNEQLGKLSAILEYVEQAKNSNQDFSEIKAQIKSSNTTLYNELGLETKTSFDEMILVLNQQKAKLDKEKKVIQKKVKARLDELIAQNATEAREKDKAIKAMLRFFNMMGLDAINQDKLNIIIARINLNPQSYGLQQAIDFENGSLGFNHDLWNKAISPTEKQSFIQIFNKMLWETIVDENIAFGTTALSPSARMRLQALNNEPVTFFMENLEKKEG